MAKDKITEYDATANNNTVCGDVNIAENSALPSDMNNFAREIMSHLKEGLGSGTPLYVDQTNNRVGINKTPTVALDVSGDADFSGTLDVAGDLTVDTNTLYVDSANNRVGVGTVSPTADGLQIFNATQPDFFMGTTADPDGFHIIYNDTDTSIGNQSNTPLRIRTNNTERVRIDQSGNVGIGTTSPDVPLEVQMTQTGGAPATSGTTQTYGILRLQGTTFTSALDFGTNGGNYAWIQSTDQTNLATNYSLLLNPNGGNVGIGTSSPNTKMTVSTGVNSSTRTFLVDNAHSGGSMYNAFGIYVGATDRLVTLSADYGDSIMAFQTNGTERMRIDSSGNLLVGRTNNPSGVSNCIYGLGNYGVTTSSGANVFINSEGLFFRSTSSQRYKNTINDATHGLTELLTLRPVTYKGNNDGDTVFGGLIAEEVHDAGLTEFVQYNDDGEPDELAYGNMVSLCIKAIQELKTELDEAKARITALETA